MVAQSIGLNVGQEAHRLETLTEDVRQRLEKSVLLIISYHIGRKNVISGARLLFELQCQGFDIKDTRYFREIINKLRKEGYAIGSTGGIKGGYWLCANMEELEAFLKVQFHDFAMDLLEQESAMRKGAARMWGIQMSVVE
jgi:hypothetical protein